MGSADTNVIKEYQPTHGSGRVKMITSQLSEGLNPEAGQLLQSVRTSDQA